MINFGTWRKLFLSVSLSSINTSNAEILSQVKADKIATKRISLYGSDPVSCPQLGTRMPLSYFLLACVFLSKFFTC